MGSCFPHLSNLCSVVNLGGSQMLHKGNVSAVVKEGHLFHLPQLFTYEFGVWKRREDRLGEAGSHG